MPLAVAVSVRAIWYGEERCMSMQAPERQAKSVEPDRGRSRYWILVVIAVVAIMAVALWLALSVQRTW